MNRALIAWTILTSMLGLMLAGVYVGLRVASKVRALTLEVSRLRDELTRVRQTVHLTAELLKLWCRTWGDPPESVKAALVNLMKSLE